MITFSGALSPDGSRRTLSVASEKEEEIDAFGLLLLPGLIDPHVHFRTPGMEHKENWFSAAQAAICGGYTTVFDMPNTQPPTITAQLLQQKKQLIEEQLAAAGILLRYQLYFGADKNHFSEIPAIRQKVAGIKVFMGCSTGNLVIDDDESLAAIFEIAARENMLLAVHAEDETLMQQRKRHFAHRKDFAVHSEIRNTAVAVKAVEKALALAKKYGTRLYILHVSAAEEIALIRAAKAEGVCVFAETTPHHLFLDDSAYQPLRGKAQVNPPLRATAHCAAVLAAIKDGVIDTIGSDHAPHTCDEKSLPYGECPSGMPGIETTLPLLLTAWDAGLLTLDEIIALTCNNPRKIFAVPENNDWVLVDIKNRKPVEESRLATRCKWSAFAGRQLTGWPVYVKLREQLFCIAARRSWINTAN